MIDRKYLHAWIWTLGLWLVAVLLSTQTGAIEDASVEVLVNLRLPRIIGATAIGAGLALSGAILQVVFGNRLCDPYVLGISGGSSLGAVAGIFVLGETAGFLGIQASAVLGAAVFCGILVSIALGDRGYGIRTLLAGVMLGVLSASLVALILVLLDPKGLMEATFWLMGDLSRLDLKSSIFLLFSVLSGALLIWRDRRVLDALLIGEEVATSSGVDWPRYRMRLLITVAFLVGMSVSLVGAVGFVGFVIPHLARVWVGTRHSKLLPLVAMLGSLVLVGADLLSRTISSSMELPVGIVMGVVGAPFFLWVLMTKGTRV